MTSCCFVQQSTRSRDRHDDGPLFSRDTSRKCPVRQRTQLRNGRHKGVALSCTAKTEEKLTGLTIEELKDRLVEEIGDTEWFVTGRVNKRLFADRFLFRDPSVKVNSIDDYATAVARLFDPATEMDIVESGITGDNEIKIVWRLEATINFLFRPKIKAYYVTTYFRTDAQGLIFEQEEFFSVPDWELLVSIFFPNFGTPPAPPVEKQ